MAALTPQGFSLLPSPQRGEAGRGAVSRLFGSTSGSPSSTLPLRGRGSAWRLLLRVLPLIIGLALLPGCGKKGPLVPPEALVPAPVGDLALAQKGARFQVSWSAPTREQGGARLTDLAGFLLFKRVLLPASEDCESCPGAYSQPPLRVDLDYPQGALRLGNRFLIDDYDLKKGMSYQYKVRSYTRDGAQSRDSNLARRTAVTAPLPPVLEALSSATGVVLSFVAIPPEEGTLTGYNIYRGKIADPVPVSPLNATPVTGPNYEDKALLIGERYRYTVTSLAKVGAETVESAPSNMVEGAIAERD